MSKIFDKNKSGVSQLINSPNSWAYKMWKDGKANDWFPHDVNMLEDIRQWKEKDFITDDEKLLIKRTLGLFSAGESLINNSIEQVEYRYITDGCCRQYLTRKAWEESLHNATVEVCCEAFSLNVEEVAEAYKNIPSIQRKDEFLMKYLDSFDESFDIKTLEGKQQFMRNFCVMYFIAEGIWFFCNFALILSLGRQGKLKGLSDQIKYTLRDESNHIDFGVNIVKIAKSEYPEIWTPEFCETLIEAFREGVEIEKEYAADVLPNGILGVNYDMLLDYVYFLANKRMLDIGLVTPRRYIFPDKKNPFTFLVEQQDLKRQAAFFERREKSYQKESNLSVTEFSDSDFDF